MNTSGYLRHAIAALILAAAGSNAAPVLAGSFALIGDMPYGDAEVGPMRQIIEEIGSDDSIAFVVHDGDIKSGSEECDDARLMARRADFDASRHPFVLVPGDNEWTDCHRPNNGRYDPEERLGKLRELFFAGDESLGRRRIKLTRQGDLQPQFAAWRENVRWEFEGTLMVGLNIPGSNNNWKPRGDNREFHARLAANTAWIDAAFAHAREARLRAVMLVMQANPDFEGDEAKKRAARPGFRDGYAEFKAQLARQAREFGKPVVVVHGDTHAYRIDRPLKDAAGSAVDNVTRLETFGSPGLGWVKVGIDAADPAVFRFTPRRYVGMP
jgi:hypothetical protein